MYVIIKFKVAVWLVPDFKSGFVGQRLIFCSPIYNASHSSDHVVSLVTHMLNNNCCMEDTESDL